MPSNTVGPCDQPHLVPTYSKSSITSTLSTTSEPVTTNTAISSHQPTACPSVVTATTTVVTATTTVVTVTTTVITATTTVVTVTATVDSTPSAMVQQQSEASSDSSDDCNIIAIVLPTVLVFIALLVVICIGIVVVKIALKRRKSANEDNTRTSVNPHISFVVENDLYQLVII